MAPVGRVEREENAFLYRPSIFISFNKNFIRQTRVTKMDVSRKRSFKNSQSTLIRAKYLNNSRIRIFSVFLSHMLYLLMVLDFRYVWEKVSGCPLSLNPPIAITLCDRNAVGFKMFWIRMAMFLFAIRIFAAKRRPDLYQKMQAYWKIMN